MMSVKETKKEVTMYVTDDGKEFLVKSEAEAHSIKMKSTKLFAVHYSPDLNETGCTTKVGYVEVRAKRGARKLATAWAERALGRSVAFVQGSGPCYNWELFEIDFDHQLAANEPMAIITGASGGSVTYY